MSFGEEKIAGGLLEIAKAIAAAAGNIHCKHRWLAPKRNPQIGTLTQQCKDCHKVRRV